MESRRNPACGCGCVCVCVCEGEREGERGGRGSPEEGLGVDQVKDALGNVKVAFAQSLREYLVGQSTEVTVAGQQSRRGCHVRDRDCSSLSGGLHGDGGDG